MDLFNLFARISIDSSEYESGVKNAKNSNEGLKKSTSALGTDFTALQNKIKVLSAQHESASKKVADLKEQFNKSAAETGVTSKKTQELADDLDAAEKEANDLKSKLDSLTSTTEDTGNKFSGLGGKITSGLASAGKLAAGGIGVIAGAATAAVGGLLALESATEEYRIAQGKLNTAFEAAGYGTDAAKQAYTDFYKILGDVDTATEASQLLAKLADSQEDLSTWTNIAAGVSGTFGDSLPIEGLIEAANETAKVGTVTGTLADALNWAGISEDEFNEKLAACSDETERNQLIMDTLSGTYDEASEAFYRNNEALVASREAQAQMDESLSKLGGTVSNVKTRLIGEFLPGLSAVVEGFAGMLSGVEGADVQFSTAVSGLINTGVSKLPEFLNFGVQILTSVLNGVVQSIPALVSAIPQVVTSVIGAFQQLWPSIVSVGSELLTMATDGILQYVPEMVRRLPDVISAFLEFINQNFPTILQKGSEFLGELALGIIEAIPDMVAKLPQIINQFTYFMANNFPAIIRTGGELLGKLAVGIIGAIPGLVAQLPAVIGAMINAIGTAWSEFSKIGVYLIEGLWSGISSMGDWLWGKVTGFFGGIVDGVKNFLGIRSPSRVFAGIGGFMAEGVGVGWDDEYSDVKKNIESGLTFTPGTVGLTTTISGSGLNRSSVGGVSYGSVNFTINARDSQSAKDIAREVADLLQIDIEKGESVFA